jgi:YD repeat-containing protein
MAVRWRGNLFGAVLLVALVASTATVVGADLRGQQGTLCTADPTTVTPGESVTLDASSVDADFVAFDKQGNGVYTTVDETDFIEQVTYNETGTYSPQVRADGDDSRVFNCGTVTVEAENQPPEAALSVSPRPGTAGQPTTLDASNSTDSDGTLVEYRWDFDGDRTIDEQTTTATTTHTYQQGSYGPRVTVVDDDGATASTGTDYFVEAPPPRARCSADPTTVTPGETVTIDARESSNGFTAEFDTEGDGTFETEREAFVLNTSYAEPGTYSPQVRVTGDGGTDTAECGAVTVEAANDPPEAVLSVSPRPGTAGQPTTLDASNSTDPDGTISEFAWDFDGDGFFDNQTTTATITHTYAPGSYSPEVTVIDDDSATASAATDYFVAESTRPRARCTVTPDTVGVDEGVTLNATASANAEFVSYDPDGDGTYERANRTTFTLDWAYAEAGTYAPQVRVRTRDRTDTAGCGNVTVEAQNQPPAAALSIAPRPGTAGQPTTFDASNATDPDGNITAYRWDFTGNRTAERVTGSPTTTYTYPQADSYVPSVTVVDDDNATASAAADYLVQEPQPGPQARCFVDPTTVAPGESVTIDARESSNAFTAAFDTEGDGTFEQERETFVLTTSYDEPGTYSPRVRVSGELGSDTAACGEVVVREANEPPEAALSVSPRPGTAGQPTTLDASNSTDSDGSIVAYRWDFDGDRTVDEQTTSATTTHTYAQGSYGPRVTVVDDDGATATVAADYLVEEPAPAPQARCSVAPTTVAPGETVTIDARESSNAFVAAFDTDDDGTFETEREAFVLNTSYVEPGTYTPSVRVTGEGGNATAACGEVVVREANEPPEAALSVSPRPGTAGQPTTLDASNSTDADGSIVAYRWDFEGDGTIEAETTSATTTHTYAQGSYGPEVTVVDNDNATASAAADYLVEEPNEPPEAALSLSPRPGLANESVTLDASNSTDPDGTITEYAWDFEGDGTVDRRTQAPTTTANLSAGEYDPSVTVVDDDNATAEATEEYTVEGPAPGDDQQAPDESGDEGQSIPWLPIGLGLGGLVGLGGLGYYLLGSGGGTGGSAGGGGGGGDTPTAKPKPKPDREQPAAYETGVFALPAESGTATVSVGFEPDVIELRSANGARTDAVVDRTEGWSQGIAVAGEPTTQHAMTVADDAHAGDQAVCAISDSAALELVRHEDDGPPGRVTVRVTETTPEGFAVDVSIPGDDPLVGGTRVLFTAIRTGSDAEAELGTFETPTEPGIQAVGLPVSADYVSLLASAAVEDTSALWTTDRSTALSVGHAVAGERIQQVAAGVSAWPGPGHATGAVCASSAALAVLYQNSERITGETRATVTGLGEQVRLRYDRVYSGPHKLGSTARHPVSYLALSSEAICPAVGQFRFPGPDQTATVDCGFQPALVEVTVVPTGPDERPTTTSTYPFGWSQGTAIARDGRLAQYVVHHAVAADPVPPVEDTDPAGDAGTTGTVAASDGGVPDGLPTDISPAGLGAEPVATEPTAHDDGRAGLWLCRSSDGTVAGRDELRVTALTETGFEATVRSLAADEREDGPRPTVVYRAWPAVSADESRTEAPDENWQATGHVDATEHSPDSRQEDTR